MKWAVIVMANAYAMGSADTFEDYAKAKREYDDRVQRERTSPFAASVALVQINEAFPGRYGWIE